MTRDRRGFTLADVMVGVVVGTLVMGVAVQVFLMLVAGSARIHAHLDLTTELRLVEVQMRRDIVTALAAGKVEVAADGTLMLEQIRAAKPGKEGFDEALVEYAQRPGPGGPRLARNGKPLSRAIVRSLVFERPKAAPELLRVKLTLADPERPVEVRSSFVISTVPALRASRAPTFPAPSAL